MSEITAAAGMPPKWWSLECFNLIRPAASARSAFARAAWLASRFHIEPDRHKKNSEKIYFGMAFLDRWSFVPLCPKIWNFGGGGFIPTWSLGIPPPCINQFITTMFDQAIQCMISINFLRNLVMNGSDSSSFFFLFFFRSYLPKPTYTKWWCWLSFQ